jgi:hypothetical protein
MKLASWSNGNDGRELAVSGHGGFPTGRCSKHGKHYLTHGETVVLGQGGAGVAEERVYEDKGSDWVGHAMAGVGAGPVAGPCIAKGAVVARESQALPAVSSGTRFTAVAAGGVPGGRARAHRLALKSDGTDEVLSEAAALRCSPPHVNKPAAIHRTKLRLLLPVQPLPPS